MPILDQNEKPISNGANRKKDVHDVRTIPLGTLIFNLIRFAGEEIGIGNMIRQLEEIKLQQKMVADPPQLGALRKHLETLEEHRFICANEINARTAGIDKARLEACGITIEDMSKIAATTTPEVAHKEE
ncbi:MAG: hypothetical protein EPN91_09585 [Salinibacterium sp.]|nr:MAG: hypothetical protein EPN91_09585 [Salinibacterium sp.]